MAKAAKHLALENGLRRGQPARVKTLNGHFDGKVIVLDEPADLRPDTKVKIIAATGQPESGLADDFTVLSEPIFEKIRNNPLDAGYDAL